MTLIRAWLRVEVFNVEKFKQKAKVLNLEKLFKTKENGECFITIQFSITTKQIAPDDWLLQQDHVLLDVKWSRA